MGQVHKAAIATDPKFGLVDVANAQLSRVERIKRFSLLTDEWRPGGDELAPTMKLTRRPIMDEYAATIDGLYD